MYFVKSPKDNDNLNFRNSKETKGTGTGNPGSVTYRRGREGKGTNVERLER